LSRYGESRTIDQRADHLLLALLFLSFPASTMAVAIVAMFGPFVGLIVNREGGGDFALTLGWWFGAGYLQWFLVIRGLRTAVRWGLRRA
jgi:apolipoprotein N-acyltransferase